MSDQRDPFTDKITAHHVSSKIFWRLQPHLKKSQIPESGLSAQSDLDPRISLLHFCTTVLHTSLQPHYWKTLLSECYRSAPLPGMSDFTNTPTSYMPSLKCHLSYWSPCMTNLFKNVTPPLIHPCYYYSLSFLCYISFPHFFRHMLTFTSFLCFLSTVCSQPHLW